MRTVLNSVDPVRFVRLLPSRANNPPSLLTCSSRELSLLRLPSLRQLSQEAPSSGGGMAISREDVTLESLTISKALLHSPAASLSVCENFIFVGATNLSLNVYRLVKEQSTPESALRGELSNYGNIPFLRAFDAAVSSGGPSEVLHVLAVANTLPRSPQSRPVPSISLSLISRTSYLRPFEIPLRHHTAHLVRFLNDRPCDNPNVFVTAGAQGALGIWDLKSNLRAPVTALLSAATDTAPLATCLEPSWGVGARGSAGRSTGVNAKTIFVGTDSGVIQMYDVRKREKFPVRQFGLTRAGIPVWRLQMISLPGTRTSGPILMSTHEDGHVVLWDDPGRAASGGLDSPGPVGQKPELPKYRIIETSPFSVCDADFYASQGPGGLSRWTHTAFCSDDSGTIVHQARLRNAWANVFAEDARRAKMGDGDGDVVMEQQAE